MLGERVYLNRDKIEIPEIHKTPLYAILKVMYLSGTVMAIWLMSSILFGVMFLVLRWYALEKVGFLDRMF